MARRAHLTIMESGSTLPTWQKTAGAQVDDWVVMIQQSDEAGADFALRVSERARRLAREGAGICAVDVVTAGTEGMGFWLSLLREVGVPAPLSNDARGPRVEAEGERHEERSGVHERPSVAKAPRRRLARAAGALP